jgi:hypothetical protein
MSEPKIFEEESFNTEDWMELLSDSDTLGVTEYGNGAKSSKIESAFELVPAQALALVSKVLYHGKEKYGKENWYGLPVSDNINHAVRHIYSTISEMQLSNRKNARHTFTAQQVDELAHAACRVLFALEQVWDAYLGVRDNITNGEVEDV